MTRRNRLMYKPQTLTEKICRWTLYALILGLLIVSWYLRYRVHPEMTKPEFANWSWSSGYAYVILLGLPVYAFLYVRSNLTAFRKMMRRPVENEK